MKGKKAFTAMIIVLSLLAALGVWVMIDGAIAWKHRPLVDNVLRSREQRSWIDPSAGGDPYGNMPYCAGWRG